MKGSIDWGSTLWSNYPYFEKLKIAGFEPGLRRLMSSPQPPQLSLLPRILNSDLFAHDCAPNAKQDPTKVTFGLIFLAEQNFFSRFEFLLRKLDDTKAGGKITKMLQ